MIFDGFRIRIPDFIAEKLVDLSADKLPGKSGF